MKQVKLDKDWLFHLGDDFTAESILDDIDSMVSIQVPHDWGTMYPVSQDNPTGHGGGYAVAGIAWYKRKFNIEKHDLSKYINIRFDGVYQNSTIYINGIKAGERAYGYSSFNVDISPFVKEGENILAICVNNSHQPNSRWYTGSGIIRPVYLEISEQVRFPHWHTFIKTNFISYEYDYANLEIQTNVQNKLDNSVDAYVVHNIFENGDKIASGSSFYSLHGNSTSKSIIMTKISNAKLWSADNPFLYTLKSTLYVNDVITDESEMKIGIREVDFDSNKGFIINGKSEKIKGMCVHHDCGLTGGVGHKETWRLRLLTLKEMGCNGIRCAHNPPSVELLDLCDEIGFYVMDEAFDEWQLGKYKHHAIKYSKVSCYGYNQFFDSEHEKDIKTMLHRDRNHPSIVIWSIGNEILEQSLQYGYEIVKKLADICHIEDPTRKITSACDKIAAPENFDSCFDSFTQALDVVGYNYVDRWSDRGEQLYDIDHAMYPDRCILGAENYSAGMIRGDYSLATEFGGFFRTLDYRYATMQHEHLWKLTSTRDYIAGDYQWTGIDYLGESAWPKKGGACAPIDCCGFKKDTFYYFKSIWNNKENTLHIAPHWNFEDDVGEYKQVIIYTNCKQVTLYCNGKLVGTKGYEFPHRGRVNTWNELVAPAVQSTNDLHLSFDVVYEPGELLAVGFDNDLKEVCRTVVKTTKEAKKIVGKQLNEGKLIHVEIFAEDKDGNEVPFATDLIHCTVIRGGRLIAMDNGDMLDHTLYSSDKRRLFAGKLLALFEKNDNMQISFKSETLSECVIDIV